MGLTPSEAADATKNSAAQGLSQYARNVTSQFGEDGILEELLERLEAPTRWCVEFGAWDGHHFSNTFNLIVNHRYSAVLIEPDQSRFRELKGRYQEYERVVPLQALVGFGADDSLDVLLAPTPIPADFDLLSIDIDGNDYHAWEAVRVYRPRLVVIEYNPTIPNTVEFVQDRDPRITHGSSLRSLVSLGRSKGYDLVAVTFTNAIFVASEYLGGLNLEPRSLDSVRPEESGVTYLFSGYDGTVFVRGCRRLLWHDVDIDEGRLQQLPRWLRACPGNYSRLQRVLGRVYFPWRRRRLSANKSR